MKRVLILFGALYLMMAVANGQQTVGEKWIFTKGLEVHGEGGVFFSDGLRPLLLQNSIANSFFQFGMAEGNGHYHGLAKKGDLLLRGRHPGGRFFITNLYTENHSENKDKVIGIVHAGSSGLFVHNNGNIRLGKYKLDMPKERLVVEGNTVVTGTLHVSEVQVKAQTADFVFEPDYNLRTLNEVAEFIQTNKHLPDIPSGAQMETDGVGLAEMNKLLLMKIEELTLYIIKQQEMINKLHVMVSEQ